MILNCGHLQIGRDETAGRPVPAREDREAAGEKDQDAHHQRHRRGILCVMIVSMHFPKTKALNIALATRTSPPIVPGQAREGQILLLHCEDESEVVQQHGDPGDKHAARRQVDEPPEDSHGALGQTHERQKHERRVQEDAHVRHAPGGRSQEDFRCLSFQCQAVEDAST